MAEFDSKLEEIHKLLAGPMNKFFSELESLKKNYSKNLGTIVKKIKEDKLRKVTHGSKRGLTSILQSIEESSIREEESSIREEESCIPIVEESILPQSSVVLRTSKRAAAKVARVKTQEGEQFLKQKWDSLRRPSAITDDTNCSLVHNYLYQKKTTKKGRSKAIYMEEEETIIIEEGALRKVLAPVVSLCALSNETLMKFSKKSTRKRKSDDYDKEKCLHSSKENLEENSTYENEKIARKIQKIKEGGFSDHSKQIVNDEVVSHQSADSSNSLKPITNMNGNCSETSNNSKLNSLNEIQALVIEDSPPNSPDNDHIQSKSQLEPPKKIICVESEKVSFDKGCEKESFLLSTIEGDRIKEGMSSEAAFTKQNENIIPLNLELNTSINNYDSIPIKEREIHKVNISVQEKSLKVANGESNEESLVPILTTTIVQPMGKEISPQKRATRARTKQQNQGLKSNIPSQEGQDLVNKVTAEALETRDDGGELESNISKDINKLEKMCDKTKNEPVYPSRVTRTRTKKKNAEVEGDETEVGVKPKSAEELCVNSRENVDVVQSEQQTLRSRTKVLKKHEKVEEDISVGNKKINVLNGEIQEISKGKKEVMAGKPMTNSELQTKEIHEPNRIRDIIQQFDEASQLTPANKVLSIQQINQEKQIASLNGKENSKVKCIIGGSHKIEKLHRGTPLATNNRIIASSASKAMANTVKQVIVKQISIEDERKKKELELMQLKKKEENVLRNKEERIKATKEETRRKREEKLKRAAATREAFEKEREEAIARLEKERGEREVHLKETLLKHREEQINQKRLVQQSKAKEVEERRLQEESARLTKIKEQEEEQKRLAEIRQKQQAEAERLHQVRLAAEQRMKTAEKLEMEKAKMKTKVVIPSQSNKKENDYGLDECSDDSTDDESAPKRKIPSWATREQRKIPLMMQELLGKTLINKFFGAPKPCNILSLFKGRPFKMRQRTSSVVWTTLPAIPSP